MGILGGMGPKATAVFMERIIERTAAQKDQDHLDMIVLNHGTLPDRTQAIESGCYESLLDAVCRDLELLERAGAAHIAIPCNTMHFFYDQMQRMTTVPIIHMVNETLRNVSESSQTIRRVGLLATNGTIRSGVYAKGCGQYGLELVAPEEPFQRGISHMIYHQVKREGNLSPVELMKAIEQMIADYGCDRVILACTELSCIPLAEDYKRFVIDAMDVLVERSIALSG